jgi:predicted naringenin-chalcone synthase
MSPHPRLVSLATAVPAHAVSQADVRERMRRLFVARDNGMERLMPAFDNAGIETRYSCVPLDWYEPGLPRWITKLMTCLGDSAIRINAIHTS